MLKNGVIDSQVRVSLTEYNQFIENGQPKKAYVMLHGAADMTSAASLADWKPSNQEIKFEIIKSNNTDEPGLMNMILQHSSNYVIIADQNESYADVVGYSICQKEIESVETNLTEVNCNDQTEIKLVVDAGVELENRFLLESAAVQFAYAFQQMKVSLVYAGNRKLRGKYDLGNGNT